MKKQDISQINKKSGEELQLFLHFKKRGYVQKNKKAYSRKQKHKNKEGKEL